MFLGYCLLVRAYIIAYGVRGYINAYRIRCYIIAYRVRAYISKYELIKKSSTSEHLS